MLCSRSIGHGSPLYDVLRSIEEQGLQCRLDRHRPDTVLVTVTIVGERLEIDVFDDGHVEVSRFTGTEAVDDDRAALDGLLRQTG